MFKRAVNYLTAWSTKYFTITSDSVYYTDSEEDFNIKEILPFNHNFSVSYGEISTGYTYGVIIKSCHRVLYMDAVTLKPLVYFVSSLKAAMV